jgi:ribosomal protein S18
MTSKKNKARAAKAALRKYKKRPNILGKEKSDFIDYKDVNLLQRFMSDRSKLRARRMNGNTVQQQRDVALAVKNAREMALLPYTKRVAANRAPRRGDDRDDDDGGYSGGRPYKGNKKPTPSRSTTTTDVPLTSTVADAATADAPITPEA